ncbi:MAG: hypothetical protein ABIB97_02925 [Patescibacteria group bacterium]
MAGIEKIGDDFLPFNDRTVSKVPGVAGTFILADKARQIVYIGFGTNLNKMLMDVKKTGNMCLGRASFYQIAMNPSPLEGAARIFSDYKEAHSGMIPRCNKYDLSVNIGRLP